MTPAQLSEMSRCGLLDRFQAKAGCMHTQEVTVHKSDVERFNREQFDKVGWP